MKVSLNTIKQYIDFELPPVNELVQKINEQLGQVEELHDVGEQYKDAIIVKVVEAEQHPNADRLRVCKVDDGGVTADVPRDESGYVQVVCGAPNAVAGMYAVWLPPNATVPASFYDQTPFVLSARELRGVLSQGMLAAADVLAIGSDHDGIVAAHVLQGHPDDDEDDQQHAHDPGHHAVAQQRALDAGNIVWFQRGVVHRHAHVVCSSFVAAPAPGSGPRTASASTTPTPVAEMS